MLGLISPPEHGSSLNSVAYVWKKFSRNSGMKIHHESEHFNPTKAFPEIKLHDTNNDLALPLVVSEGTFKVNSKQEFTNSATPSPLFWAKPQAYTGVTLMRRMSMYRGPLKQLPRLPGPRNCHYFKTLTMMQGTISYRMQASVQKKSRAPCWSFIKYVKLAMIAHARNTSISDSSRG